MTLVIVTDDPFERNKEKLAIVDEITRILFKHFPNHQVCYPKLYIADTIYHRGGPNIEKDGNNITNVRFGILTAEPNDNRKRIFGITLEDKPKPLVIGDISIGFKNIETVIIKIKISVFGSNNKQCLLEFSKELDNGKLDHIRALLYLQVESENPKRLQ